MTVAIASERAAHFEGLRGAAAVQVVLAHSVAFYAPSWAAAASFDGSFASVMSLSPLRFAYDGTCAVYLFFVLSGYVLTAPFADQRRNAVAVLAGRAVRLWVPTVCAALLGSALALAFLPSIADPAALPETPGWWRPDLTVAGIVRHTVLIGAMGYDGISAFGASILPYRESSNAALWTMGRELHGSILILILARLRVRPALWLALVIGLAAFYLNTFFVCFLAGHLLAANPVTDRIAQRRFPFGLLMMAAAILLAYAAGLEDVAAWSFGVDAQALRRAAAILLFVGVCASPRSKAAMSTPLMARLGVWSFPIYLVHWPIMAFAGGYVAVSVATAWPVAATPAALIVSAVATIGCAAVFLRIDRWSQRLGSAISKRRLSLATPARIARSRAA